MLRLVWQARVDRGSGPARADELQPLVQPAARGDADASRTLLAIVGPPMLRATRRVLGREHPEVEDVVQEAAYALLKALDRFRGECTVLHFACRIAVQTAMNARRRLAAEKRAGAIIDAAEPDAIGSDAWSPDRALSARDSAELLRDLVATLPEAQAEVLALHTMVGYTVSEIADSCGVPLETVRSRLRLAKQALRERVASDPRLREAWAEAE
jgi:RNA polymerase sigma-70 factor (ECF subfamily)